MYTRNYYTDYRKEYLNGKLHQTIMNHLILLIENAHYSQFFIYFEGKMTSITPVNSGRQSYKGFFYNLSVATQQCSSWSLHSFNEWKHTPRRTPRFLDCKMRNHIFSSPFHLVALLGNCYVYCYFARIIHTFVHLVSQNTYSCIQSNYINTYWTKDVF